MAFPNAHLTLALRIPFSFAHAVFVMYAQFYHFNGFVIYLHATQTHIRTQHERSSQRTSVKEKACWLSFVYGSTEKHIWQSMRCECVCVHLGLCVLAKEVAAAAAAAAIFFSRLQHFYQTKILLFRSQRFSFVCVSQMIFN